MIADERRSHAARGGRPGVFAIGTWFVCGLAAVVALFAWLPPSVLGAGGDLRRHVRQVLPEGWPLFTRDPAAPYWRVASESDGTWVWADIGPLAQPSNAFGLSKQSIARSVEVGLLLAQLPSLDRWGTCRGSPLGCLRRPDPQSRGPRVINRRKPPSLCGRVGFVHQGPVPWVKRSSARYRPPARVVVADVRCSYNN